MGMISLKAGSLAGKSLVIAASVIGMCWQLLVMSDLFFQYNVVTHLDMRLPNVIETEVVTMCSRYTDVLNYSAIDADLSRGWNYTQDVSTIHSYQGAMSINDIFKYKPNVSQVFNKLHYRPAAPMMTMHVIEGHENVLQLFYVTKFLNQQHVCYQFWMRDNVEHEIDFLNASPIGPGMVYAIVFDGHYLISRSNWIKILITKQSQGLPYNSIDFAPEIHRRYDIRVNRAQYTHFTSYKIGIHVQRLPTPYVSDCYDYSKEGYQSDSHCMHTCLYSKAISQWNKVPFSVIVNDSSPQRLISYEDVKDNVLKQRLIHMEEECRQRFCRRKSCQDDVSLTSTSYGNGNRLLILFTTPAQYWHFVRTKAAFTTVEYILQLMGIVGTYTGLCVLSVSPKRLIRLVKRTIRCLKKA